MRIYTRELGQNYSTYSFGYTLHAEVESGDDLATVYAGGFLPYSHKPGTNLFYMARSLRLRVEDFSPTSENRRVFQKYDGQFTVTYRSGSEIGESAHFKDLFLHYFNERHGSSVMPEARMEDILQKDLPLRLACYAKDGTPVAYVLEVTGPTYLHYWFSCYELSYANSALGMWLMLDSVRRATAEGLTHVYVGTGYGQKAKYKTNIPNLSFWDGTTWNDDEKKLKELLQTDQGRETTATSALYTR